jgi:hypothetical protein
MPHFSLLILFLILIQSGKRGKCNYTIHGKIVMPEQTHVYTRTHTYIHFYIDRLADSPALPGYIVDPRRELSWSCLYLSFYNLRDQLLPSIYLWLWNCCLAINNSPLLVSADMSHVPVAWQWPGWDIFVVMEPLPSYQQFPIVGFRGCETCTQCLAMARLGHTHFLRYFGPLGRMPHFSLLILFLIQSGKRGKCNYTIQGKIYARTYTHTHTYIHFYVDGCVFIWLPYMSHVL